MKHMRQKKRVGGTVSIAVNVLQFGMKCAVTKVNKIPNDIRTG